MDLRYFLALLCCTSFTLQAEIRHYSAWIDVSEWQLSQDDPLQCRLEHEIPHFGKAVFSSYASKQPNLAFSLVMQSKPAKLTQAKLISVAPAWRPGSTGKPMAELNYQQHFNGEVSQHTAWSMLTELEAGMTPTFYYSDWHDEYKQIAVGLSPANFKASYRDFKACQSQLLGYSFDDVAMTIVHYAPGESELTAYDQAQLEKVTTYLALDDAIQRVVIEAYTDSYGSRERNQSLSEKRAQSIKALLASSGIDKDRIVTAAHGERRHVASNRSEQERSRNRRVVIKLSKSL